MGRRQGENCFLSLPHLDPYRVMTPGGAAVAVGGTGVGGTGVGGTGVGQRRAVAVAVGDAVPVGVTVSVAVAVAVGDAVAVAVSVAVAVGVADGVAVGVAVAVGIAVAGQAGVAVAVAGPQPQRAAAISNTAATISKTAAAAKTTSSRRFSIFTSFLNKVQRRICSENKSFSQPSINVLPLKDIKS